MQLDWKGTPVLQSLAAEQAMELFVTKLVPRLYVRLPRFVRMFVSQEQLVALLRSEIQRMAVSE